MAIAILLVAYASSGAFAIRASWMRAIVASFAFYASLLLDPAIAIADPFLVSPAVAVAASFDDVFAIMSLPSGGDSPGCSGCHIAMGFAEPCPLSGTTHWGETQDGVLDCLTRRGYLDGGRDGTLAQVLGLVDGLPPRMPRFADLGDGRFWNQDELDVLGAWLDSLGCP